jgi:hypothetical protein
MKSSFNKIICFSQYLRFLGLILLGASRMAGSDTEPASASRMKPPPLPKIQVAPDGRSFITDQGKPFNPLGVTYYRPGTGWAPQVWKQFDAEATRQDFARMKQLGINCARVFLTYGSFQSSTNTLNPEGLAKFDRFLELAEAAGIYVHPTGPDHWEGTPDWARGDAYADENLLLAREEFWRLFAARYAGRSVIFAYDLLNEPAVGWKSASMRQRWNDWLRQKYGDTEKTARSWSVSPATIELGNVSPPDFKDAPGNPQLLDYQHFREEIAFQWTKRQVSAIKSVDPKALVTVGFIQWTVPALLPNLSVYSGFRPQRQAPLLDFLEIHFYPLENGFYEYDLEGETRNLAYLECVVREVAGFGKPVVLAEFGWYGGGQLTIDSGKHRPSIEGDQSRWCRLAVETTQGLAVGWLNWGLYDHPQARDVSQLTGLLTVDGQIKAWGTKVQKFAEQFAQQPPQMQPRLQPNRPALNWDLLLTSQASAPQFRAQYLEAYKTSRAQALSK